MKKFWSVKKQKPNTTHGNTEEIHNHEHPDSARTIQDNMYQNEINLDNNPEKSMNFGDLETGFRKC